MKNKYLQKGEANTFLIISILGASAIMGAVIYYTANNTLVGNYKSRSTGITQIITTPTPAPKYNLKKKFVSKKECISKDLNIEFSVPESWNCQNNNGFLVMTSDYFTVNISNLGRGTYCVDTPDSKIKCNVTSFLSTPNYDIKIYNADGVDKELFGTIINSTTIPKSWISIVYKDIETEKPTIEKNAELIDILNTLKVTN